MLPLLLLLLVERYCYYYHYYCWTIFGASSINHYTKNISPQIVDQNLPPLFHYYILYYSKGNHNSEVLLYNLRVLLFFRFASWIKLFRFSYTFVFVFLSVVTSDVQDIEVCLYDSTFILQCKFIPGSTISGCGYTLVHRQGVANISGQIPRTNGRGGHVKVNETTDYLEIVVYDTPNRENLSNIRIPIVKSLRGLSSCPTTENGNSRGTSHFSSSKLFLLTLLAFCFWFISLCSPIATS